MVARKTYLKLAGDLAPLAAVLAAWEGASRAGILQATYFPPPSAVIARLFELLFTGRELSVEIAHSLKRLLAGAAIAVPAGVVIGFTAGSSKKADSFISPLVAATYPVPKLAILPFFLLLFGIGEPSQIALIAVGIFYLVFFGVVRGIRSLPPVYLDICRVYRTTPADRLYFVVWKGILPDILHGAKVGVSYGLVMVVAGEFIAARNGIGFFLWNSWDQFRVTDLYVSLLVLSLIGLAIFALFDLLSKKIRWLPERKNDDRPVL